MLNEILSAVHWRLAKSYRDKDKRKFGIHLFKAVENRPQNDAKLRRAAGFFVEERMYGEALTLCDKQLASDPSEYWSHYKSFVEELSLSKKSDSKFKLALFNDTDFRVNIGCRLTSQGLKDTVLKSFPDAAITSLGFRFSAFRKDFGTSIAHRDPELKQLKERLEVAYGEHAFHAIVDSNFVVLQPEGSLDHKTSLEGLATFFTPVLVSHRLGKPFAVVNGTIPIYLDQRDDYLRTLFETLRFVAARDEMSANHHNVKFLADAAFLRITAPKIADRHGCLITTGARNDEEEDVKIFKAALEVCDALSLRPIVLTHAVERFGAFENKIASRGGIFAETASVEKAAETISRCRLHIGGRYHMAIFSILCQVPSLLFDVKTHKNQWLAQYSPLVRLVQPGSDLRAEAKDLVRKAPVEWSAAVVGYDAFLKAAYNSFSS